LKSYEFFPDPVFFPVEPENVLADPVGKLRFFPVKPENMRAVTSVSVEPEIRVPIPGAALLILDTLLF